MAFAVSRPLRKIRLPLEIAVAATLAKYVPAMTRVQLSTLTTAFIPYVLVSVLTNDGNLGRKNTKVETPSWLRKFASKATQVVDQYGAAYLIGSRITGLALVSGLYLAILQGVDLSPILEKFGIAEFGSVLGTWSAAVVFSSALYPFTLSATGYIVPWLVRRVKKY